MPTVLLIYSIINRSEPSQSCIIRKNLSFLFPHTPSPPFLSIHCTIEFVALSRPYLYIRPSGFSLLWSGIVPLVLPEESLLLTVPGF